MHDIRVQAVPNGDSGQGLPGLVGFGEDLQLECPSVAAARPGGARLSGVVIHYGYPLKNRWAPTLASNTCMGR